MSHLKTKPKGRDPPPALFLHPSPAASHVSLPGMMAAGAATSAVNSIQESVAPPVPTQKQVPTGNVGLTRTSSLLNPNAKAVRRQAPPHPARLQTADSTRTTDRTDALWAEMLATLEEVELSASGGTHVFGPDHDRKLAELRTAQIALAQAWARSEADDAIETREAASATDMEKEVRNLMGSLGSATGDGLTHTISGKGDGPDGRGGSTVSGSGRPGSSGPGLGTERLGQKLEEETEADILLARKRREANDRYFSRVDRGVRDVVNKLEEVAVAMRAVEQESRDVWGDESGAEK